MFGLFCGLSQLCFFGYIPHHVNFRSILCNIPIWYTKKDLDGPSITPPKKWIALKFKFLRMLQILLYLYERKTHLVLIVFILSNFHFSLMNTLIYIFIDHSIYRWRRKSCSKWKNYLHFLFWKYNKFTSIFLEYKLDCLSWSRTYGD